MTDGSATSSHTGNQSINTNVRKNFPNYPEDGGVGFALEAFINSLQTHVYKTLPPEAKQEYVNKFDALEMFNALEELNRELAQVKLENHFLIDFLEKNDPKLLIGLKTRRVTAAVQRQSNVSSNLSTYSSQQNIRRSVTSKRSVALSVYTTTQSIYTTHSSAKKGYGPQVDYHLNYKAKADMAEKASSDVEKRIRDFESKAMHDIKLLNARIEELRFRTNETQETAKNFQLHFLKDERDLQFLETGSEKQIERKFRKFVNNWLKCARALLSTMRLRCTALQESCQQNRNDLITKADLSGILGAVDFEQLIIKRGQLLTSLDEKNAHMAGLKGVTGKASLAMTEEKQVMMAIEDESKQIQNKTVEVIKMISKLEREANLVEEENKKDMKIMKQLKEQLERYEAPSVNQYIEKKDELITLEKEEKMLQRKIYILNMKLNNIFKKCKKKQENY